MKVSQLLGKNYSLLPYRIAFCSGEDIKHPAIELLVPGVNCKGWQSIPYSTYPQVMVLQFMGVVGLKQIEFLSHQAKISSKIEIFSFAPEKLHDLPGPEKLQELKFNRLGYITLGTNEENGFSARELKTIKLDYPVFYLKLVFYKNYSNKLNPLNQVGIVAINCIGETSYTPSAKPSVEEKPQLQMEYDKETKEKLDMLYAAKERAVEMEDFDRARFIKETIFKLKALGQQLAILEYKKRMAIQNEDFVSAKIIKTEILRLRRSVLPEQEEPISAPTSTSISAPKNPIRPKPHELPITQDLILEDEEQKLAKLDKKLPKQLKDASSPEDIANRNLYTKVYTDIKENSANIPFDEKPIRASKKPAKMTEYPDEQPPDEDEQAPVRQKAEALVGKKKKMAEPYYPYFDMPLLELLFSKDWANREEGLKNNIYN